jgi:hypothetical protein
MGELWQETRINIPKNWWLLTFATLNKKCSNLWQLYRKNAKNYLSK